VERHAGAVAVAVAAMLSACGGDGLYGLPTIEKCLREKGYDPKVVEVSDIKALQGGPTGAVIAIGSRDDPVEVAFEQDTDGARKRENIMRAVLTTFGDAADVVARERNVVYWTRSGKRPGKTFDDVDNCLSE
jgi:hypothetical protein